MHSFPGKLNNAWDAFLFEEQFETKRSSIAFPFSPQLSRYLALFVPPRNSAGVTSPRHIRIAAKTGLPVKRGG